MCGGMGSISLYILFIEDAHVLVAEMLNGPNRGELGPYIVETEPPTRARYVFGTGRFAIVIWACC
jgi:hypothetical protein